MKTKQELATAQRIRYHSDPEVKRKKNESSANWIRNNQKRVNTNQRKVYARLPQEQKDARNAKIKMMRKTGVWKS